MTDGDQRDAETRGRIRNDSDELLGTGEGLSETQEETIEDEADDQHEVDRHDAPA